MAKDPRVESAISHWARAALHEALGRDEFESNARLIKAARIQAN